jgi:peptide/nickel transport system ATP-binding protein
MSEALAVDDLHISAGALPLVRGISFAVEAGATLTIIGDTGSGKTLVVEAVMGTLPRELSASGQVSINGARFAADDAVGRRALWGRRIAMLPQEPWLSLDPTMRAAAQVAEVHRFVRGASRVDACARARSGLAELGLADAGRRYPFELSGGMAQRVALATIRAGAADIVIADEPTKGLDAALRDDVLALLRGEVARGATLIVITHDVAMARGLGGAVAVMLDGLIVEHGPAERVLHAPAHDYTRRLLASEPGAWSEPARTVAGAPVIVARGLTKSLGGRILFTGLDLAISAGEVVAVCGPSGCGKTTLGNVLLGLLRADSGSVERMAGNPLLFQKIYQDPPASFAPRATLRLALADVCRLHAVAWRNVEALMVQLRLADRLLDRTPDQVSGGELQRFSLLRVLLLDPVFLFADEATSRLDPITQQQVVALLRDAAVERQLAVLVVTHDGELAGKAATRTLAIEWDGSAGARHRERGA